MPQTIWKSVLGVSAACILWALLLDPSPEDESFRYGYFISGAACLLAFVFERFKQSRLATFLLFLGSIAYLLLPGKTTAWLLISGKWDLLASTISATYNAPVIMNFTTIQALSWRTDLLLFVVTFTLYFFVILLTLVYAAVAKYLYPRLHRPV